MFQTYKILNDGINYLQNEFPDFTYQDEKLDVNTEQKMVISGENSYVGKTIIDTKTDDEVLINQYINDISKEGSGMIILKDKVILKNGTMAGTVNYSYQEILGQMKITEFTKQSVIDYAKSPKINNLYISIFITIFIYSFIMYLLTTLSNAVFLSVFGYLTTWVAKIKMRFVAIFNMAIYSLTLSIILNMIYLAVNIFINFNMQYFQVMYVAVAAIYLVAAIFLLKADFVKKQMELMKLAEAQEIIRKEMEEQERREKEKKEKEDRKKKDKEEEKKEKEQGRWRRTRRCIKYWL